MKLIISTILLALLSVFALATEVPKDQIIVSYPKGTPAQVYNKAKVAIKAAGGTILTEYKLIMGFVAKAPKKTLDEIRTMGKSYGVVIEQDQTVSINSPP